MTHSDRAGEPAAGESVGASESLDDPSSAAAALPLRKVDVRQDPRIASYPADRLPDHYGSLSTRLGITDDCGETSALSAPPAVALRWRVGCYGEVAGKRGS